MWGILEKNIFVCHCSSVDETHLDQFLMSLSPDRSVDTYQMLGMGLNRNLLPQLTNE